MTGRELILYILSNGLEDEPVFKDGKPVGFLTEIEAAMKYEVGLATLRLWAQLGYIESIKIGEVFYISDSSVKPNERKTNNT